MFSSQAVITRMKRGARLGFLVAALGGLLAMAHGINPPTAAVAQANSGLEATIFSFDGKDFLRVKTTLVTEKGSSAAETKLDHASPAYRALMRKHSYTGETTLFGKKYQADYAPLTDGSGKLTGAIFVAVSM